jgi:hypothetical protein
MSVEPDASDAPVKTAASVKPVASSVETVDQDASSVKTVEQDASKKMSVEPVEPPVEPSDAEEDLKAALAAEDTETMTAKQRKLLYAKLRRYILSMQMHMIHPGIHKAPAPMNDPNLADGAFVTQMLARQYYKHLHLPSIPFWHVSSPDAPIAYSSADTLMSTAAAVTAIEDSYNAEKTKRAMRRVSSGLSHQDASGASGVSLSHQGALGVSLSHQGASRLSHQGVSGVLGASGASYTAYAYQPIGDATYVDVGGPSNFYALPDCSPACLYGHPMVALNENSGAPCSVCGETIDANKASTCSCCAKGFAVCHGCFSAYDMQTTLHLTAMRNHEIYKNAAEYLVKQPERAQEFEGVANSIKKKIAEIISTIRMVNGINNLRSPPPTGVV